MSDEALCYGVPKPKFPPSYYTTHNITPSPGNDWVCRTSGWEWQQTAAEKVATAIAEKESEDLPYTPTTRAMYSTVYVDGVKYKVHIDSEGRDVFYKDNEICYLYSTWWVNPKDKYEGEKFVKKCVPWKTSDVGVFETGRVWDPEKGEEVEHKPGISLPDIPSIPSPADWVKSLQIIAVVVMLFIIIIVYIIFVKGKGASGVSVGSVG